MTAPLGPRLGLAALDGIKSRLAPSLSLFPHSLPTALSAPRSSCSPFRPRVTIPTSLSGRAYTQTAGMSNNSSSIVPSSSEESAFMRAVVNRRSLYTLANTCAIPLDELKQILTTTLENAPSTFGSYTTRVVVLTGAQHSKLWDMTREIVKAVTPPEAFESHTKPRLDGFRGAHGTILFFEDPANTRKLQDQFAFAKDHFPVWAQHTSAIHQFIVWTALAERGVGANLQHYNPLIDNKVKAEWDLPTDWTLVAQMPFGDPIAPPKPKPTQMKAPLEERLRVF